MYSPNGPMLEFEVAGNRNNFIDLQRIFIEAKCKNLQSSEANLEYDGTAAADVTMCCIHCSLTELCQPTD